MSQLSQLSLISAITTSLATLATPIFAAHASPHPPQLTFQHFSQAPTQKPTYLAQQEYAQLLTADSATQTTVNTTSPRRTKNNSTLKNSLVINAYNAPVLYRLVTGVYQLLQSAVPTVAIFHRPTSRSWLEQNDLAYAVRYSDKNGILYVGHELVQQLSDTELQTAILDTLWQHQNSFFTSAKLGWGCASVTKLALKVIEVAALGAAAILTISFLAGLSYVSAGTILPLAVLIVSPCCLVAGTAYSSRQLIDYLTPTTPAPTPTVAAAMTPTTDLTAQLQALAPQIATVRHKISRLKLLAA